MIYIFISLILLSIAIPIYFYREDLRSFNKGICPHCGHRLVHTHTDHNGRIWECPHCKYRTVIYYESVDGYKHDDDF
jgi:DNA-directed RNA polymerase subunit RPC12/RpoP